MNGLPALLDGLPGSPPPAIYPANVQPGPDPYGEQSVEVWKEGETDQRSILDKTRGHYLWLVTVTGDVTCDVTYGTKATRVIRGLIAPFKLALPGQVIVYARPNSPTTCKASLTLATGSGIAEARSIVDSTGGAVDLDEQAFSYFALTDSTLNIRGIAVVAPALSRVPLVAGSQLATGSGYQEYQT